MFPIPKNYQRFKMLAIDPGLNNLGFSIFTFNNDFDHLVSVDPLTIVVDKEEGFFSFDETYHPDRLHKLLKIRQAVTAMIQFHNPCIVVSEAPFYNRLRPTAFRPLCEAIQTLEIACYDCNPDIPFFQIPPLKVKQAVNAGSTKGKIDVLTSIQQLPELLSKITVDITKLSDHAVDSIAVGHAYLTYFKGQLK